MRYPIILQHDATDCGPAALAMIGAFHRKRLSLAVLREAAATDRHGSNLAGLAAAAERIGFSAKAVKTTPQALPKLPMPAVAHWRENNRNHFVALYKVTCEQAVIGDPAIGLRRLPIDEFNAYWTGVLLLVSPGGALKHHVNRPTSFSRLCRLLLPHRRLFLDALLAAVLMTILSLASSFFIQALVDYVFVLGRKPALNLLSLGMLLVLLARTAFQTLRTYLLARLSLRIDAETVFAFHRHLLGLPLPFFVRRKTGEILSRVNDAIKIRMALTAATLGVIVDGLLVVAAVAFMTWLDWKLSAASLALMPLLIAVVWLTNRPMKVRQRQAMERGAEVEAAMVENLSAIQTIKACRAEARVQTRIEARFSEMLEASYLAQLLAIRSSTVSTLAAGASSLTLLWYGGRHVLEGTLSIGQLMAFQALLGAILGPIERLSNVNQPILDAIVAADRLGEFLELEGELGSDRANALDRTLEGAIEFCDVACRYGASPPVFEHLNFRIEPGECVGIAGESGSGKTTLVNLLARFLEPSTGRITIDGVALADYTLECLRREIAYVPQDIMLLNASIADNIRLGHPTASPADIRAAGRLARLDALIAKLPFAYDTVVGERGASLSGGERQRIAIARAILSDPSVLVLDEPTSHLDPNSSLAVNDVLKSRRGRRTTLVISHHPLNVDRVISLDATKPLCEAAYFSTSLPR